MVFTAAEDENPDIKYKIIVGNVVWSVLLAETIVAPIYFFGWSLYEPTRLKVDNEKKGQV